MAAYQIFREVILLLNIAPIYTMVTGSMDSDEADVNKAKFLHAVYIALGVVICMLLLMFVVLKRECLGKLFSSLISPCCRIQNDEKCTVEPAVKFDTNPMCRNLNQSEIDNLQTGEADDDEQSQDDLRIITIVNGRANVAAAAAAATDDDDDDDDDYKDAEDHADIDEDQSLLK
ncbi:uncharacterized protein LOC132755857 [Ruditapes philippinarum]|uniref:uncharacterized protein LOC132755857 n=1 Tax=Ruditapes philippinarum TaxID=129788 RepID=UPI00295A8BBF|nr:uncharacterized protein LOC132755857 [Ruditapes philippinarum]XP_060602771.1 uncharacterized protein LOC132755857 [Ruditapes philippinarum]